MYLSVNRLCFLLPGLIGIFVLPATVYAESEKDIEFAMPKDMVAFEGQCEQLIVAGKDERETCKGKLSLTFFKNGRAVYTVFLKDKKVFTFSGSKAIKREGYIHRFGLDRVYGMSLENKLGAAIEKIPVTGQCELDSLDNPKPTITCKSVKDGGDKFEMVFKVENSTMKPLPKLPGPKTARKVFDQCAYISLMGLYYQAAITNIKTPRGQLAYIIKKMQQTRKVSDPRNLEKILSIYFVLLQKIDFFKPDTRAAYVYGACVAMGSLKKKIPDDAESVQYINTMLNKCEKVSINRKVLNDCIGPKLAGIVRKDYLKKPKVLNPQKQKKIIAHCGYMSQVGQHIRDVNEMALMGHEKVVYIISKMQEHGKVDDVKKLEKNVVVYIALLQQINRFKAGTNAAYVRAACKYIHNSETPIPSDAGFIKTINTMLKQCEIASPGTDELRTCVDKQLTGIIIKNQLGII